MLKLLGGGGGGDGKGVTNSCRGALKFNFNTFKFFSSFTLWSFPFECFKGGDVSSSSPFLLLEVAGGFLAGLVLPFPAAGFLLPAEGADDVTDSVSEGLSGDMSDSGWLAGA